MRAGWMLDGIVVGGVIVLLPPAAPRTVFHMRLWRGALPGLPTLPAGLLGFNGTAAELQATLANAPQEAEGGGFQAFLGSLAECYERCGKGAAPAPAPAGDK